MAKNLNYDDLRDFKTPTQKRNAAMSLMILSDMKRIDVTVSAGKFEQLKSLHIELDGTYQNQIKNWGSSMYNYVKGMGARRKILCKRFSTKSRISRYQCA